MNHRQKRQITSLVFAGILMSFGLFLLKYIPMQIWGDDILFDASFHITLASFVLYIIWFFIDQNRNWRIPFFLFVILVFSVISFQRIHANAHNDIGLLIGLLISAISIYFSNAKIKKGKFKF
jgi:hypothetical protein